MAKPKYMVIPPYDEDEAILFYTDAALKAFMLEMYEDDPSDGYEVYLVGDKVKTVITTTIAIGK